MKQKRKDLKKYLLLLAIPVILGYTQSVTQNLERLEEREACINTTIGGGIIPMLQELTILQTIFAEDLREVEEEQKSKIMKNMGAKQKVTKQTGIGVLCANIPFCQNLRKEINDVIIKNQIATIGDLLLILESQSKSITILSGSTATTESILDEMDTLTRESVLYGLLFSCMEDLAIWPQDCDTATPDACCDFIPDVFKNFKIVSRIQNCEDLDV